MTRIGSLHAADHDPLDGVTQTLDRTAAAFVSQLTSGLSPVTMTLAYLDWIAHLAISPGKQVQLSTKAMRKVGRIADYAIRRAGNAEAAPAIEPLPQDRRFADPAWTRQPFDLIAQAFLLNQQWWHAATTGIGGVSQHHEDMVSFAARQLLDVFAPTNFLATNPVLQRKIVETGGQCLVEGARHWWEDAQRLGRGEPPVGSEQFVVGETVAATPGKVVYRNDLIELIQYSPTTETVHSEPILIVPAWNHEILHSRPLAGQFTGALARWRGPHGVHDLLAQSGQRGSRSRHG